jgi:hypothetical protein
MVPFDAGQVHLENNLEAFLWIRVVPDNIAQADNMGGVLAFNVVQNNLKSFQIAMDVGDDGVFHYLLDNFKTFKIILRGAPVCLFVADKASKSRAANRITKCLQFIPRTLRNKFDPAIRQIADGAGDFKTGGDRPGGVTKTNALHAA